MPNRKRQTGAKAPAAEPLAKKAGSFLQRRSLPVAVALVAIASLRIVATYTVFNHTSDEPAHVACGMEWLDKGTYTWEPQHPPLARVATALGPYLSGIRSQNTAKSVFLAMSREGAAILYKGHRYDRTLSLARLGILPFFWMACAVVYWWGRRYYGPAVALAAVFLFSFLPPVLAHAGLATTDMALTAMLGAAFVLGMVWLERPTLTHGALFGAVSGLMVLSKFSSLAFFPASVALALAWYLYRERPGWRPLAGAVKARIPSFALGVAVSVLVIWAGYRFSFGDAGFAHLRLPFPELYAGIREVQEHNAQGHDSFLLGSLNHSGFWCYYLVGLAVKTPLAFLVLLGAGVFLQWGRLRTPLAFAAGILLVGMSTRINIGIRHILPIYIGLSLAAAAGLVKLLEIGETRRRLGIILAVLLIWFAGSSLAAHPDYLPYFNELVMSDPENVLVDSDLDWGQDLKRLSARLRQGGATDVSFDRYIVGDWEKEHGFPRIHTMNKYAPGVGWNAIGVSFWKESRLVLWPDKIKPQERVGKSILIWYFPPSAAQ